MSHITALNKAYSDNYGENILICEDDFTIQNMDYCNKMLEFLFDKIPHWDVIMLGQNTIYSQDTGLETPKKEKIIKIKNSQTTSGYLLKRSYIPRLLHLFTFQTPTFNVVDVIKIWNIIKIKKTNRYFVY